MASQGAIEREVAIFEQHQREGQTRWFIRVSCNFFEPRVYGPFPDERAAERFRRGCGVRTPKIVRRPTPEPVRRFPFPCPSLKKPLIINRLRPQKMGATLSIFFVLYGTV